MKKLLLITAVLGVTYLVLKKKKQPSLAVNEPYNPEHRETCLDCNGHIDKVEESSQESFPASDSPSTY